MGGLKPVWVGPENFPDFQFNKIAARAQFWQSPAGETFVKKVFPAAPFKKLYGDKKLYGVGRIRLCPWPKSFPGF
jgi:hypothetical protein